MNKRVGLYWFTNDLRLNDNQLLRLAAQQVDELLCFYCLPKISPFTHRYAQEYSFGKAKQQFIIESLWELGAELEKFGQKLIIATPEHAYIELLSIIKRFGVTSLYCEHFSGSDEQKIVGQLQHQLSDLEVFQQGNSTLFDEEQLPFSIENLPTSFTQFRKLVEANIKPNKPYEWHGRLPPYPKHSPESVALVYPSTLSSSYRGGLLSGEEHCAQYFSTRYPSYYKETRNALDGQYETTKFSLWLAHGCLSPKIIYQHLQMYESKYGANESTYWIYFELLWREYFYWYAKRYEKALFSFTGITQDKPLTSFYGQRFLAWKHGQTPFPIVNACMNQLKATGFISNRGRQLVASCLVNELQLDWRYGAAYFETQLIDYDVASNWGNWQYLAGVGADPRGSRQFNLQKQTELYDPENKFIQQWQGDNGLSTMDDVDMVDWPVV
ncbi:DASH family cryptochrome [Vibrio viridaestus]|uniref:Cryptochrome DASH n=1 Tax=Vibrio viridaestus TaxID=2487322 RepID=A0A3N9TG74_9VIBR|nr:DASH family cryptochrome [Vibrio viridaestus]RQW63149.1 DASH family cryptochrome [Vibrio viridaestus]